jgi:hypothetical protein
MFTVTSVGVVAPAAKQGSVALKLQGGVVTRISVVEANWIAA